MILLKNRYLLCLELLLLGYGVTFLAVVVFENYSMRLFLLGPLIFGCLVVTVIRKHPSEDFPDWFKSFAFAAMILPAGLMCLILLVMLFTGFEGAICLLMALPLVAGAVVVGGALAFWMDMLTKSGSRLLAMIWFVTCLLIFVFLWSEAQASNDSLLKVSTTIEIDASPETVWRNVIAFELLPEPEEWLFKTGIAYPIQARIEGEGVGAIRYCEFSTGSFVEPITVWDAPHLLAFDVTENPEPMKELSPWGDINPSHIEGYMVSRKGQFELERLPGDRTRLTGTTWYEHGLGPEWYWTLWSDWIIHKIHLRVLGHIKVLSES